MRAVDHCGFSTLSFGSREPNSRNIYFQDISSGSSLKAASDFSAIFVNGDRLRPVVVRQPHY
jgi:hypothetical protein